MDKEVGKINKGEYQGTVTDIVLGVREYNGRIGVDIREHVTSDRYTGPTKKGLRIPAERFAEFKQMINSISEADLKASEGSENSESSGGSAQQNSGSAKPENKNQEELPDY